MTQATNLGYPRIGRNRELKKAVEGYWSGSIGRDELQHRARQLRAVHWREQFGAGLGQVPSNDFSLYDHVLDTCALVGAVPARYKHEGGQVDLNTYFAMARGESDSDGEGAIPMEMTKWFDTNYHYIVPEFHRGQSFELGSRKPIDELRESQELRIPTRPVLLGPVSFLMLGKAEDGSDPLELLDALLPVYARLLQELEQAGGTWVQFDEPMLVMDLNGAQRSAYKRCYESLAEASGLKLFLTTYFGGLRDQLPTAVRLPVDALHVDLAREPEQLADVLENLPTSMTLSAGVVDGRNVWRNDLDQSLALLQRAAEHVGPDRLWVAPSSSLLHVPLDLEAETGLDPQLRSWLAFGRQKLDELTWLAKAVDEGASAIADALEASRQAIREREASSEVNRPAVRKRLEAVSPEDTKRDRPYVERRDAQREAMELPTMPTTTIGSFPQTAALRTKRASYRRGEISEDEYTRFLEQEVERNVRLQEEIGLDVLVHGEPERTDMVEYFGEQLTGIAFTEAGWVQSFGTRCVRPPIIYGDVSRPEPMTVDWTRYAQSLTNRPMKGMLTGPITILQWSFVRVDQPRSTTAQQIALAIRDEVQDLERAAIRAIQIDEPALREGLPLRENDRDGYLGWAVPCFRLASCGVVDRTQIHTHMCYAEFNDMMQAIADLDADVLSLEASRSRMSLLEAFKDFAYPNEIGAGVYDIHSPRVPSAEEMADLLCGALERLAPDQVWVNPDCGLKTRNWEEVRPALENMVQAAGHVRHELAPEPA